MGLTELNALFVEDASRLIGEIAMTGRLPQAKLSAFLKKGFIPDGSGFNFNSVQTERTKVTSTAGWTEIEATPVSSNNCVPTADRVASATTVRPFNAFQRFIDSEVFCLTQARAGYEFRQQTANKKKNYTEAIRDVWALKDAEEYDAACKYKMVMDQDLTATVDSAPFPATPPTSILVQGALDELHTNLTQDGAGEYAYGYQNGKPIYTLWLSTEAQQGLIINNPSIRQDFNFAQMGESYESMLLRRCGFDKTYGGWFHRIDDTMPRFNFDEDLGEFVQVEYYENIPTTEGNSAEVSTAYKTANYEMVRIWCPEVVKRLMHKPLDSVGADTKFSSADVFGGDVRWLNFRNISAEYNNPDGTIGFYRAGMQAAWEPSLTRYGMTLLISRCPNNRFTLIPCS